MPDRPLPSTKPLIEKLGVKPGQRILIGNAPADVSIGALPDCVEVALEGAGPFDAVLLFVHNRAEIEAHASAALSVVKPGGLLWLAYPKKGKGVDTDISRDAGWESVRAAGWETVSRGR